jgi:hypothetical protein
MSANYKSISATNQVKVGLTILKGIFVSAASSTPLITVYDSGTATLVTQRYWVCLFPQQRVIICLPRMA